MNRKVIYKNKRKFFFFRDLDAHFNIELFGKIRILIKNKNKFAGYSEVKACGLNKDKRSPMLIVSLTSFPGRIKYVHITLNTLLNQTLKPDKLILWLAECQFPKKEEDLPQELLRLKDFGLEIKWCEDIRSYKKLVPALREFPNDIIVTADDDIYYQEDWLESLYNSYLDNPNCIHVRRASRAELKNDVVYITSHYANNHFEPSYSNQLLGGSGCLFPPNSLHEDVLNIGKIQTLIPTHDDIYFWVMGILQGSKIKLIKNDDVNLFTVKHTQSCGLCKINKSNNVGISVKEAYRKIFDTYPNALEKIQEET